MQIKRIIAKGQVVPLLFQEAAVADAQTNAQLVVVDVGTSPSLVDGYVMPFAGSVIAISAALDSAASAGSLTIGATIGGTEDAASTITITTETEKYLAIQRGEIPFDAGAVLGAEITTASWNGTTSDLAVHVWVLLKLEGI